MSKRRAKRMGASRWAEQIAAQEQSGLSQRVFCERRGLSLSSFARWRGRLRDAGALAPSRQPSKFIEIELPAPAKPLVRVSLGAVTIDFETLPPPGWVFELAALEAERC